MAAEDEYLNFQSPGTQFRGIMGGDIASGDLVIAPTHLIHRVTGTSAITSITVPYTEFAGLFIALPTGIFTWTTAGNIILAGTAVVGKCIIFVYNPVAAKWYPSVVA